MFYCDLSTPSYPQPTNVSNSKLYLHSGVISSLAIYCPGHYHHWPYVQTVCFWDIKMYLQCQRFCPGMIILNRHSQHILPDNWSKPLSIYPPQSPSLVVSKKRERNMQFQMYRWLTLKCQCSAKFRGCYRINGNVKVSKTRYA